jgi:hypothetical protein
MTFNDNRPWTLGGAGVKQARKKSDQRTSTVDSTDLVENAQKTYGSLERPFVNNKYTF